MEQICQAKKKDGAACDAIACYVEALGRGSYYFSCGRHRDSHTTGNSNESQIQKVDASWLPYLINAEEIRAESLLEKHQRLTKETDSLWEEIKATQKRTESLRKMIEKEK